MSNVIKSELSGSKKVLGAYIREIPIVEFGRSIGQMVSSLFQAIANRFTRQHFNGLSDQQIARLSAESFVAIPSHDQGSTSASVTHVARGCLGDPKTVHAEGAQISLLSRYGADFAWI